MNCEQAKQSCGQVQSLLAAYLDGEVTPSERVLIRAHLSGCTDCQQELDLLSTARSQVRSALQRRASQAVPSREAWNRLEARLSKMQESLLPEAAQPSPTQYRTRRSHQVPVVSRFIHRLFSGETIMRKRYILGTSTAILAIAMVTVLVFNNVVPVSAQTILDRASAAQVAEAAIQGIQHTRIEIYENLQAVEGEDAGTLTIDESYYDPATGYYRSVTQDSAGKILQIFANDGSCTYSAMEEDTRKSPVTVHRLPLNQDQLRKGQIGTGIAAESLFEHFRNNPRVELLGKETWADGRQVYILVSRNTQTEKLSNGQQQESFTGTVKMVFDAENYQLVASETTVYKDGKEIVIEKVNFLVDEILQPGSQIDWSLSDLQGITFVDDPQAEPEEEVSFEILSEEQLVARAEDAYVLKNIPDGFTLEITAVANQPQDQPYSYEIHYRGPSDEYFGLQVVGVMDEGFIETSFYDGSYKSAVGLVLNYSSSRPENAGKGTAAMLTVPDGTSFLVESTLSRAEVEALVENLVPLK